MTPSPLSRQAFVIGVSSFGAGLVPLDRAADHARGFAELLRGVFHFDTESLLDPTCSEMDGALRRAAASPAAGVVVHVLSHGEWVWVGDALWVASREAGRPVRSTGWIDLRSWLAAAVNDHPGGPPILVVLDVCSAGSAAGYEWLAQRAEQEERRVWVIGATEEGHSAYGARFTRAMRTVLQRLADGELKSLDPSQEYLTLDLLSSETWHELKNLVDAERGMPQRLAASVRELGVIDRPPLFPNPNYRRDPLRAAGVEPALAALADDVLDAQHFGSKAAGSHTGAAPGGCCFTGRKSELTMLSGWINEGPAAPGALRVVTGSPGAGKSALLGALVCLAHPELAGHAGPLRIRIPQRIAPYLQPRGGIAAVHARNRTFDELVASICRQWDITIPGDDRPAVEHLRRQLQGRSAAPLLVLDALDEALDPVGVMLGLLVPLVSVPDGIPLCRMVVGTRPWRPQFGALLDLASADGLVDLDRVDRGQLVEDIGDYVLDQHRDFLAGRPETGENPKAWEETARVIAETVTAGRPTAGGGDVEVGSFLLAQLYVHHLHRSGAAPSRHTAADIGAAAPRFIGQALALDLDRPETSRWTRPLLMATAHARGVGMPMMLIRTVARAIAASPAPADPADWGTAADQAMFYLRSSVDTDGTTVYRLFHQGLINSLTQEPTRGGRW